MSHNLLNGEVIKGRHPALIDEDLFLRANEIKKTDGYTSNKANDNLPLKLFVKDAESGAPFTGYLVKKKGLYYYKVNRIGIRTNRSPNIMHDKFKELLATYTEKLNQKLSNPKELIQFTCKLSANLAPIWASGDYYQKQIFQNVVFPNGLVYDSKIEHYRTPVVNSAIAYIADLSKGLEKNKSRTSSQFEEKSDCVPEIGLKPKFKTEDFQEMLEVIEVVKPYLDI